MAGALSELDWTLIDWLTFEKASRIGEDSKASVINFYASIKHNTQYPPASKEMVVNLCGKPLDDALYSVLWTGLNYAVAPTVLPIQDILSGVEKAMKTLPADMAEEARQETEDYQGLF